MQNIFRVLVCLDLCAAGAEFSRHLDHTRGQTCCMYSSGKKPLPNSEQGVKRKLLSTNHLGTIQASHEQEHCMAIPCKTNASFLFDKSETPKFDPEYRNGQTPRPPTHPPPRSIAHHTSTSGMVVRLSWRCKARKRNRCSPCRKKLLCLISIVKRLQSTGMTPRIQNNCAVTELGL